MHWLIAGQALYFACKNPGETVITIHLSTQEGSYPFRMVCTHLRSGIAGIDGTHGFEKQD